MMGTTTSSESVTLAQALRAQRTQTQAEVHALAEKHPAKARYGPHDRTAPGAH
jgi:hypothetical protein